MKNNEQDLRFRLCEVYFSDLNNLNKKSINLEDICLKAKLPYNKVKKIIPENSVNNIFLLKLLITKLDNETLEEFKTDISDDTISSTYDKILEGLTLRFEKFLEYKSAFKIISDSPQSRIQNFLKLSKQNYSFMNNLLNIVESNQNYNIKKTIKSIALNFLFINVIEIFLKDENNNLDSTVRYLDKYLSDLQELGTLTGIINKKL